MNFATRLRELRTENELTQVELAELLEVHRITVSRWERATLLPGYSALIKVSTLFGVSSDYLLGLDRISDESKTDIRQSM